MRRSEPDLIHTHLVHADIYGSIASRATRVPLVSSRHNDDRYLLGGFRHIDRVFARRARQIIAISDAVRIFLEQAGLPRSKLVTVHYGLDALPSAASEVTPPELGIRPDAPLLLAIGRLIAQKDHETLLRAFAGVRASHPEAVLAILGAGPLEAETRQLVTSLRLDGAVHLPGRIETRDWLERADVFVHTSRWEGFGIVLLEAMLAALPIVATRVSAVPEVVVDGLDGRPCRAGRCRRALERSLARPRRRRSRPRARAPRPRTRSHGVFDRQHGRRNVGGLRCCIASRRPIDHEHLRPAKGPDTALD